MNKSTKIRRYAEGTSVPVQTSKAELEALLQRYGASGFYSSWDSDEGVQVIGFRMRERILRLEVKIPGDSDVIQPHRLPHQPEKRAEWYRSAVENEHRRRWRALVLIVKAKLEIVASGEAPFETEFLAHILLPDGQTVGRALLPKLAEAYDSGKMPKRLLPGPA